MNLIKFLITSVIASFSLAAGDIENGQDGLDGWFPVEPIEKEMAQDEEGDPSIWTLFTKHFEEGDVWARFPAEPHYEYAPDGSLIVTAKSGEECFQMTVQPDSGKGPEGLDLFYPSEGKWVSEHHIRSNGHQIVLKVVSDQVDSPQAQTFFSSFSIEKNG